MTKIRMQGPANTGGFTHDGVSYEADENDIIELPSHISGHAKAHGFTPIVEKGPKKPEPLAKGAGAKAGEEGSGENGGKKDAGAKGAGAKAGE